MSPQDAKNSPSGGKVVVSVGTPRRDFNINRDAREIIQDARDEAFRIKKSAEEEVRKIRQEVIEIEKRIAQKEESLDSKMTQFTKLEGQIETTKEAYRKKDQR